MLCKKTKPIIYPCDEVYLFIDQAIDAHPAWTQCLGPESHKSLGIDKANELVMCFGGVALKGGLNMEVLI